MAAPAALPASYPPPGYPPPGDYYRDPYYGRDGRPPSYGHPEAASGYGYPYGPPPPPSHHHHHHPYPYPPPPAHPGYGPPPAHVHHHGYAYPPPPHSGYGPPAPPAYGYPPPAPPGYGPPAPPLHTGYPPSPGGYFSYGPPLRPSSRSRSPRRGSGETSKYTCRFYIGIENDDQFRVAKRIIGANGIRMKDIVAKSGGDAKLRLRGKGSGFVERDTNEESPEPLQLCISCPRRDGYDIARRAAEELLLQVYSDYKTWCEENGKPCVALKINMSERHHASSDANTSGTVTSKPAAKKRGGRGKRPKGAPAPAPAAAAAARPTKPADVDRGEPPPGAPAVEEIEKRITDRNNCRKRGEFGKADEIREELRKKGVVLSDEKGGHGSGLLVTSWRYWHE